MISRSSSLLIAIALAGCAGRINAPSLAPRPIESRNVFAEPATPDAGAVTADAAFDARVQAALAGAAAGEAAFATALEQARRLVPEGAHAAIGSDPWVAAQQALTTLDAARGPAAAALADLDSLRLEASARDVPPATAALDAALDHVGAIEMAQRSAYRAIADTLPSG